MPHLVTNRPRHYSSPSYGQVQALEAFNLLSYLIGGLLFIVGSVFFLPAYRAYIKQGAILYAVGATLYTLVTLHDVFEGLIAFGSDWAVRKHDTWKVVELVANCMYTVGGALFIVGSILFLPEINKSVDGAYLYIIGSILYGIGSVINMFMIYTEASPIMIQMLNFISVNFLCGSILFVVGNILYVFEFSGLNVTDNYIVFTYAGWEFIAGSLFFTLGGIINAFRIVIAGRYHKEYKNASSIRKFFERLANAEWRELVLGAKEDRDFFRKERERFKEKFGSSKKDFKSNEEFVNDQDL